MVIKPNTNNRSIIKDEAGSIEMSLEVSYESSSEEDEYEQDSPPRMHSTDISMVNENDDQTESEEWDHNECRFEYEHETEERYPFPEECETFDRELHSWKMLLLDKENIQTQSSCDNSYTYVNPDGEKRACGERVDPDLS